MNTRRLVNRPVWPAFNLRLPPEQKLALAAEAQRNGRSLNAEIVIRLRRSLERYQPGP